RTQASRVWFHLWDGYGISVGSSAKSNLAVPNLVLGGQPPKPGDPVEVTRLLGDPVETGGILQQTRTIRTAIGDSTRVTYNRTLIGAQGSDAASAARAAAGEGA